MRWKSAAAKRFAAAAPESATLEEALAVIVKRLLEGLPRPPTDLDAVGQRLGVVSVESAELLGSGELIKDGNRFRIRYAAELGETRMRFTVAHELGHAFLETTGAGCPRHGDELEKLCDMFAAELLMPTDALRSLTPSPPTASAVYDLTRVFRVSRQALSYRCRDLLGLHAFEISLDGTLLFSTGLVRVVDDELMEALEKARGGADYEGFRHGGYARSSGGWWKIEGVSLPRRDAVFFVARPSGGPQLANKVSR